MVPTRRRRVVARTESSAVSTHLKAVFAQKNVPEVTSDIARPSSFNAILTNVGTLYVQDRQFAFDDWLFAHLRFVISQKLRRGESFLLTWSKEANEGSGRTSIWMTESMFLHFQFAKGRTPPLNPQWLEAMMEASYRLGGLVLDDVLEPRERPPGEARAGA